MLRIILKLKGKVSEWFRSRPEYLMLKMNEFKEEISNMYSVEEDVIVVVKKFEACKRDIFVMLLG